MSYLLLAIYGLTFFLNLVNIISFAEIRLFFEFMHFDFYYLFRSILTFHDHFANYYVLTL